MGNSTSTVNWVALYQNTEFSGDYILLGPVQISNFETIPTSSLQGYSGLTPNSSGNVNFNDEMSSFIIPAGFTVTMWTDSNYTGTQYGPYTGPFKVANAGGSFNDSISSIQITGSAAPSTGKTVTGEIKQTSHAITYRNGGCGPGTANKNCLAGDWKVGTDNCGSIINASQPTCSSMQDGLCPAIGTGPYDMEWANGSTDSTVNNNSTYSLVNCIYDVNNFQTGADVTAFLTGNVSNPWQNQSTVVSSYDSVLMPYFCGQQVTTCPVDPTTAAAMPACSRFVSTANDGSAAACQAWIAAGLQGTQFTSANADATMTAYCTKYNTPDCGCINRASSTAYQIGAAQQTGNDGCWFVPCKNPADYLIPSSVNTANPAIKACPSTCEVNVTNIASNYGVNNIGPIEAQIACTFITNPPGSPPTSTTTPGIINTPPGTPTSPPAGTPATPPGTTPATPPAGTPATSSSSGISGFFHRFPWWAWVIFGVILLFLIAGIIGIILAVVHRSHANANAGSTTIPAGAQLT